MPNADHTHAFTIAGLTPASIYYYRTCMTKNGEVKYGNVSSFTTSTPITLTTTSSDITSYSANVKVTVSTPQNYKIQSVGVQYTLASNDIEKGTKLTGSYQSSNTYTASLSKLSANTIYQYRAYAYVYYPSIGVYDYLYGLTYRFTTATMPKPTVSISNKTAFGGTFTITTPNTNTYNITQCGIQYATTSKGVTSGTNVYGSWKSTLSYVLTVSNWSPSTTYYYRPFYYSANGGYVYGDIQSVTTEKAPEMSFILTSTGSYPWTKTTGVGSGNNCLCSSNYGISSSTSASTLTIYVGSKFTLSFNYKVSSESGYDKLTISVDGKTVANNISGTSSSSYSSSLSSGTHTISMSYSKDGSGNKNNDRGYIYDIAIDGNQITNSEIQ